jgi:hypothetical protein
MTLSGKIVKQVLNLKRILKPLFLENFIILWTFGDMFEFLQIMRLLTLC